MSSISIKLLVAGIVSSLAFAGIAQYPGYELVESDYVPSNDTFVTSGVHLTSGVTYLFEASGTWSWNVNQPATLADARWLTTDSWASWFDDWFDPNFGGLDPIGLRIGRNTDIIWGDYSTSHLYTAKIVGAGSAVSLHIFDQFVSSGFEAYGDNSGGLTVNIYKPVPEPSSMAGLVSAAALFAGRRRLRRR